MKLLVNNKETELTQGQTIAALAQQLELPNQGVAIAWFHVRNGKTPS